MLKKMRGFTLIELLIVVAIIGILAALLIPNALAAIQKAKQKTAMKEIMTMSTGAMDYITDHGDWSAITQGAGPMETNTGIVTAIAPFYIKACPINDPWNFPYQVAVGTDNLNGWLNGTAAADLGGDDFIFGSGGRNGEFPSATYDPANPDSSRYNVEGMTSFDNDLVAWSGSWVIAPATVLVSGT